MNSSKVIEVNACLALGNGARAIYTDTNGNAMQISTICIWHVLCELYTRYTYLFARGIVLP